MFFTSDRLALELPVIQRRLLLAETVHSNWKETVPSMCCHLT